MATTADLRALVSEKAEFLSGRLKELVSSGQGYIRAQFGLDLGLKPELYPGWMVLSTAAVGLLLLVAVSWAALCGGLLTGKQRGSPVSHTGVGGGGGGEPMIKPHHFIKNAKPEEQKKKNKKKSTDKKVQSNGGVVTVEEVNISETAVSKPSTQIKTEKVEQVPTTQAKKNKRKAKAEAKPTQNVYTIDGKEDDGAWETKVSSREKRQQRRKDKGPEDSGTVEGLTGHVEPPAAPAVTNSRKHRESQQRRSNGKGDAGSAHATSSWREEPSVNGGGWTDGSLKMASGLEGEKWSSGSSASRHRAQPETQCWGQETQVTWSGVDRMKPDLNPVSFSILGLNTTESMSQPIDLQWDRHPDVSDEWSGFNGMAGVDSSSDWNAPAEHWGNYEEPPVLLTPAAPPKEQAAPLKVSEDEKEVEDPSEGTAKSKKKKKKKKKAEDDATQAVSEVSHEAPPSMPSSQKKSEQTVESSKSFQKKKVRRET